MSVKAQTCPVCQGRGFVPCGFYNTSGIGSSSSISDEKCRSCFGRGYLCLYDYCDNKASVVPDGKGGWKIEGWLNGEPPDKNEEGK